MKRLFLFIIVILLIIGAVIVVLPDYISDSEQLNLIQPIAVTFLIVLGILSVIANLLQIRESELFGGFFKSEPKKSNEDILLEQVYDQWVKTYLYDTLGDSDTFDIQLDIKPHAVLRGQRFEKYKDELPDVSSKILELYKLAEKKLLILGEPGSGKTFLLIQLAEQLLKEARNNTYVMPVILNLSSWAAKQLPFEEWLIDELKRQYGISKKLGEKWIKFERLTYLLDGLDEVADTHRLDCVKAINSFQKQYKNASIVICSRAKEFGALATELSLDGAIQLQALTEKQIEDYITRDEYEGFWECYDKDQTIRELAQIPFMLQSMAYSYRSLIAMQLELGEGQNRIQHIFDIYIEKRPKQKPSCNYTPQQSIHFLTWLASQLVKHDMTQFYIEILQRSWLKNKIIRLVYRWLVSITYGLAIGMTVTFFIGLIGGLSVCLYVTLYVCLVFRLEYIKVSDGLSWHLSKESLVYGLFVGLVGGLFDGLIGGLFIGLVVGLFGGLEKSSHLQRRQKANDGIRASIKNGIISGLFGGIAGGVAGGVFGTLFDGLIGGLFIGLVIGLYGALKLFSNVQYRRANDGIRASIKNGIISGLFGGIAGGLFGILFISLFNGLVGGLLGAVVGGLFGGLSGGWDATIQHSMLRWLLYRSGVAPLNYADFLDYAVSTGFMRQIGAGYAFRHDYLRQYFAGLYKAEEVS